MSNQQEDPKIKQLSEQVESLKKENAEFDEKSKKQQEEDVNKFEEQAKEFDAKKEGLMEEFEKQAEAHAEEKEKLHEEMKKIAESKGVKVNINPKGCYSDSKTRKAKLAAEEAKKSKSKKD